jgi:hypothetical protein
MGLSRLDNFLKNIKGEIIYVDSNNIDSTDSVENQGNSLSRPFKTLQRALIESARFSYQGGLNNDRYNKTTILLYPGDHYVDNRPGWIPTTQDNFLLRGGTSSTNFTPFSSSSNFDLTSSSNDLYKLNSIHGGIIVPRGTSIVGIDLRKTKIIPRYVPNPENDNIERSSIFRVTGACYFWQISLLDSDINDFCYKDYSTNKFSGNFSHHKLTCFEYVDGVNPVSINDEFVTYSTERTDLDMYYEKIGLLFGSSSNREIPNDYPSVNLDIQPRIEEYRIVGTRSNEVGISSIRAGDGVTSSTLITAILSEPLDEINVDTIVRVEGINSSGYDGEHIITNVINSQEIQYEVDSVPVDPNPSTSGSTMNIIIDTVDSASPYIFNCSLRSVYGMCGMHADGSKATGFKSMVVAQFTGIGLQKDNNAFVKYNSSTGVYQDTNTLGNENIHTDSRARFKPSYENYHIKCSNDAYIQVVSVFAIGFAKHFLAESGGDQSINNSNSNFGSSSLVASGFRSSSFPKDDIGYITHIIPPKQIESESTSLEFYSLDVSKTKTTGNTNKLYLYGETDENIKPEHVYQGYKIGSKENDKLNLTIGNYTYSSVIVMPNSEKTSSKKSTVSLNISGISSISDNILTFTESHEFLEGESIRITSSNGYLPTGLVEDQVYYAITNAIDFTDSNVQIKIAKTFNDALNGNEVPINSAGGILTIESRVSDKSPGEIGHPIQWDQSQSNWYLTVSSNTSKNKIISGISTSSLISSSSRTYFERSSDLRNINDTIYQVRYVIPSDSPFTARPPLEGYVIQESNSTIGDSNSEVEKIKSLNSVSINNSTELRNFRIINNAEWSSIVVSGSGNNSGIATFTTEIPHDLLVGSKVEVVSVGSTNNQTALDNFGYNGTFEVLGISTNYTQFSVELPTDPGTFTGTSSSRTTSLPRFKKKFLKDTLIVYRSDEIQEYIKGQQDGIYNLTLLNASNSPNASPFENLKFLQPIKNLYPQIDKDNIKSDPKESISYANNEVLGKVVLNDPRNSETKETINKLLLNFGISKKISNISQDTTNIHEVTITTEKNHGLNKINSLSIETNGTGYGTGVSGVFYDAKLVGGSGYDATGIVSVNNSGQITNVKILNGGSNYTVNDILTITGIGTFGTTFENSTVKVTSIYDCEDEIIQISGINHERYNTIARIKDVISENTIKVHLDNSYYHQNLPNYGSQDLSDASYCLVGSKGITYTGGVVNKNQKTIELYVSSVSEFSVNDIVRISNNVYSQSSYSPLFDPDLTVNYERNFRIIGVGTTSITVNYGNLTDDEITSIISTGSNINFVCQNGISSKLGTSDTINSRLIPLYGEAIGTLQSTISSKTVSTIQINSLTTLSLDIGDYLQINNELCRIKSTVPTSSGSTQVIVFRGVLGSQSQTHASGDKVKRIRIIPIELRRNSLIRASAHTFEYIGFGPGNYSTAFPEKQDRKLSADEERLAHSQRIDGGISVFSSMNADGNFYIGNKKINSASGKEEIFDIPIPSNVGEQDYKKTGYNIIESDKVSVSKSIKVEGGKNSKDISEFYGPVLFNDKITSTSSKGLESVSLFLQGDERISRKYTISASTPTLEGNPGDIVFNSNPTDKQNIGWICTIQNSWEPFGDSPGVSITEDLTSNSEHHVVFTPTLNSTTAVSSLKSSNQLKYIPSTGELSAAKYSGDGEKLTNVNTQAIIPKQSDKSGNPFESYLYETRESFTISENKTISGNSLYGNTVFTSLGKIEVGAGSTLTISNGTIFKIDNISGVFSDDDPNESIILDSSKLLKFKGSVEIILNESFS